MTGVGVVAWPGESYCDLARGGDVVVTLAGVGVVTWPEGGSVVTWLRVGGREVFDLWCCPPNPTTFTERIINTCENIKLACFATRAVEINYLNWY